MQLQRLMKVFLSHFTVHCLDLKLLTPSQGVSTWDLVVTFLVKIRLLKAEVQSPLH